MDQEQSICLLEEAVPNLRARIEGVEFDLTFVDDEVLSSFRNHMRSAAINLKTAIPAKDIECIKREAHDLKGMGTHIGYPELSAAGEELETRIEAEDMQGCTAIAVAIQGWIDQESQAHGESGSSCAS